jgi:hypothetical protein
MRVLPLFYEVKAKLESPVFVLTSLSVQVHRGHRCVLRDRRPDEWPDAQG